MRKEVGIFIKILTKTYNDVKRYYASLIENKRINGKYEGVTEQLKAEEQMEWVSQMNNIRNRVTVIVNNELIYI